MIFCESNPVLATKQAGPPTCGYLGNQDLGSIPKCRFNAAHDAEKEAKQDCHPREMTVVAF
jgi:hypothetical protein